jgi:hypothetical protein
VQPLGLFEPRDAEKAKANVLLSRYLCRQPSVLTIRGDSPTISSIPYLQSALSVMDTSVIMPPLQEPLLLSSTMLLQPYAMLSLSALSRFSVPSQIQIRNPLSVPIQITRLSGNVFHQEVKISSMSQVFEEEPIRIDAAEALLVPQHIYQKLEVGAQHLWTIFSEAMNHDLDVFVSSVMDVYVGDYLIRHLKYEQDHVPAHLATPFV